jgi:hypothetical protein
MRGIAARVLCFVTVSALILQTAWLPSHLVADHHPAFSSTDTDHHDQHSHHHSHDHIADFHDAITDVSPDSNEQHPASDHDQLEGRLVNGLTFFSVAVLPDRVSSVVLPTRKDTAIVPPTSLILRSQIDRRFTQSRAPPSV